METTLQCRPIFKDLFLIIRPASTWDRLAARPSARFAFVYYLLPMLLLTAMIEGYGLVRLGRQQVAEGMHNRFSFPMVFLYETGSGLLTLGLLFAAAAFIKSFANACHARNQFSQGLRVMYLAIGPMLLIQWFNGFPNMYHWLTWLVGMSLCIASLYHGLPRIMRPDPPSAMGLFVSSGAMVFLLMVGGQILTTFYLAGDIKSVEKALYTFTCKLFDLPSIDD